MMLKSRSKFEPAHCCMHFNIKRSKPAITFNAVQNWINAMRLIAAVSSILEIPVAAIDPLSQCLDQSWLFQKRLQHGMAEHVLIAQQEHSTMTGRAELITLAVDVAHAFSNGCIDIETAQAADT